MARAALDAMHEQLIYWKDECEEAHKSGDSDRVERCERFIKQCKQVIGALEGAIRGASKA